MKEKDRTHNGTILRIKILSISVSIVNKTINILIKKIQHLLNVNFYKFGNYKAIFNDNLVGVSK